MSNKKCAIFLNGNIEDYSFIKKKLIDDLFIIGVDGGIRHIESLDLKPDLLLGDFDSFSYKEATHYKNAELRKYNSEKEYTDGEIAIKYVIENNYNQVFIFGALGNRMDHSLANISMLEKLNDNNIKGIISDKNNEIIFLKEKLILNDFDFDYFSIIPISKKVEGIFIKGAKYELENALLLRTESRGVSNEFIGKKVEITVKKGKALLIKSNSK